MSSEFALHLECLVLQNQDVSQCIEGAFWKLHLIIWCLPKADAYTPLGDFCFYFSLIISKVWFGVRSIPNEGHVVELEEGLVLVGQKVYPGEINM